ncbi:ATP-binding protein [bacterium]|nr:ATP-binding protein [bacterium]
MTLKYLKKNLQIKVENPQLNVKKLRIKAKTTELKRVREFIGEFAESIGCSEYKSYEIQLVVDEICTNIIQYSYPEKESKFQMKLIWIECEGNQKTMIVRIIDKGVPFDLLKYKAPTISENLQHPQKGGWGIPIIKAFSDKIKVKELKEDPTKNILELHFNLM